MGVALVLGCGECVWDDAKRAQELFVPDVFVAVKDMMALWPGRVDFAVTLHPERLEKMKEQRIKAGRKFDFEVWTHKRMTPFPVQITADWQGSSGLLAVKVCLEKGHAVVLAGVPMEKQAGHVARKKEWDSAGLYYNGWKKHKPEMAQRVRSMSGWTKEFLGAPDAAWLAHLGATRPVSQPVA